MEVTNTGIKKCKKFHLYNKIKLHCADLRPVNSWRVRLRRNDGRELTAASSLQQFALNSIFV